MNKIFVKSTTAFMLKSILCFLLIAICACVIILECDSIDTAWKRKVYSRRIHKLYMSAKQAPENNNKYILKIVRIAKGKYRFGAVQAVVAIGKLGDRFQPFSAELCDLLRSKDPYVSREAAIAISNLGPSARECIDCVVKVFHESDPNQDVTWFCVEALQNMGCSVTELNPILNSRLGESIYLDEFINRALNKVSKE